MQRSILLRELGLQSYANTLERMHRFTDLRSPDTADELWLLQHTPIYTLGQAGDPGHILDAGDTEVLQTDRGGQVTYHGPGQLIIYVMVDLRRLNLGVRTLVELMENSVIDLLSGYGVAAQSRRDAPGVYVSDKKISALGLRVRHGRTFHGLSLNVDMDLEPFSRINPCGYQGLEVTQLIDQGISLPIDQAGAALGAILLDKLTAAGTETSMDNKDRN